MNIDVRPLALHDLPEADRIFRLAFGTFLGLREPLGFMGDADLIGPRWRAAPAASLGAYVDGTTLVGSNVMADWGSFGFFGPLTVLPAYWDKGVAKRLTAATMERFEQWGTQQTGLFTFAHSAKHIGLYRKFGFRPQQLTPVMAKSVTPGAADAGHASGRWSTFSEVPTHVRPALLAACLGLTDAIQPGLDLRREIDAVWQQRLGDTVFVHDDQELVAFGVCHLGAGSEAGSGASYLKFGAARPGPSAAADFDRLLAACEALASTRSVAQLMAGVNTARQDAHRIMRARGFQTVLEGLAMQRPDLPGTHRPDCFVIDDWR